jgi:hypothetical protein
MTISPFLKDRVFGPQDTEAMSTAFEGLCETLNLPDEAKGERERLTKKIIALARPGDCSAALLRGGILREIAYGRGGRVAGSQPPHLPNEVEVRPFSDGRLARKRRKQFGRRGAR